MQLKLHINTIGMELCDRSMGGRFLVAMQYIMPLYDIVCFIQQTSVCIMLGGQHICNCPLFYIHNL